MGVEPRQSGGRVLTLTPCYGMKGPCPVLSTWQIAALHKGPFCLGQPFSLKESSEHSGSSLHILQARLGAGVGGGGGEGSTVG